MSPSLCSVETTALIISGRNLMMTSDSIPICEFAIRSGSKKGSRKMLIVFIGEILLKSWADAIMAAVISDAYFSTLVRRVSRTRWVFWARQKAAFDRDVWGVSLIMRGEYVKNASTLTFVLIRYRSRITNLFMHYLVLFMLGRPKLFTLRIVKLLDLCRTRFLTSLSFV